MKKIYVISTITLIVGLIFSLIISFYQGGLKFENICELASNQNITENFYGFEECKNEDKRTYIEDPISLFFISLLLASIPLFVSQMSRKSLFITYIGVTATFIALMLVAQILLNTFPYVSFDGWQDAGWTLKEQTPLFQNIGDLVSSKSSYFPAVPFTIVIDIIFAFISFSGIFLSALICNKTKKTNSKVIYFIKLISLTIGLQVVIYILMFPITLWFAFGWI